MIRGYPAGDMSDRPGMILLPLELMMDGDTAVDLTISMGQLVYGLAFLLGLAGAWFAGFRKARPFLRHAAFIVDDWNGVADRPGVKGRPGVMLRLAGAEEGIADVKRILVPNGGSSLADQVNRIEEAVASQGKRIEDLALIVGRGVVVTPSAPVTVTVDPLGGLPGHPNSMVPTQGS